MKLFITGTKLFAILTLLFVNFSAVAGQTDSIYRLAAGSKIRVTIETELSSKIASANDTFIVKIAEPVSNNGVIVIPAGTVIEGKVVGSSPASSGGRNGRLDVRFETLRLAENETRNIDGVLIEPLRARSGKTFTALSIGGFTAAGALFGAIANVKNGAAYGALIGAGSGTGLAALRKGNEVGIKPNKIFVIELRKEVTLPVKDF